MSLPPDDPRVQLFGSVGFDRALSGIRLTSLGEGRATAELEVAEPVQNWVGTLHGGAIATLVDDVGTVAIMSADREGRAGVTTDLNVSYLNAAPHGARVRASGRVLKVGRTLAFVEVDIHRLGEDGEPGALVAQGRMTKFMGR
ncbi:MAG: PaaI family thioesterase [Planctomycetota bacterium]